MEKLELNSRKREATDGKANSLRKKGCLPAVLYGKGVENISLVLDKREFKKILDKAGTNTLVNLNIEGKEERIPILFQDPQFDPVTDEIIHIDFHQVKLTEKIVTHIPFHFFGESKAVKDLGGTLVKNKDEIEVECLPKDLPHDIRIDISILDDFEKSIHVKDLEIPPGVKVLDDLEDTVAVVEPPRTEEELAELETPLEEVPVEEEIVPEEEAKEAEEEQEKE